MSSFHLYCWSQFKVIPLACTLRTRNLPKLRRRTRVDSTANNADNSESQAASDDRLLSHVTQAASNAGSKQLAHRYPVASSRILYCGHSTQYSRLVFVYCYDSTDQPCTQLTHTHTHTHTHTQTDNRLAPSYRHPQWRTHGFCFDARTTVTFPAKKHCHYYTEVRRLS